MDRIIELQRKIVPELMPLLLERYRILRQVEHSAPIGRRVLAQKVGLSERVLRSQVDFLRLHGLVKFTPLGVKITAQGKDVLDGLSAYVGNVRKLTDLTELLRVRLGLKELIIIPGDSDKDPVVKQEIGRAAAEILHRLLSDCGIHIVAVSGGSTLAATAENVYGYSPLTIFVPARGAIGDKAEEQANTIAAELAERTSAKYRQLYIPDNVKGSVLQELVASDWEIADAVSTIRDADILIHGMRCALGAGEKRCLTAEQQAILEKGGAVCESMGQYFDRTGKLVYMTDSAGLALKDINQMRTVVGVAGGSSKALAIYAFFLATPHEDILVTDEGAARGIYELLQGMRGCEG